MATSDYGRRSPPPHRATGGRPRSRSRSPRRGGDDRDRRAPRDDRDRRSGGNSSRRDEDDRRGSGYSRRSRSPPARRARSPPAGAGDGGWSARGGERGERGQSPGRPSLALEKRGPLPSQQELVGGAGGDGAVVVKEPVKPIEPNFAPSGALAAETNTLRGVVLKYNEPPEARRPVKSWRMYVFKGKEQVDLFHVNRQSAYLLGRDRIVADIPIDHPSTSKQHAVLQFRQVVERNEFGDTKSLTKPYIIDLDSANGTMVNDETVPPSRYYEVKSGDVLKFAFSTREYVLLAE